MKKILFLVNHDIVIYNFRLEIVERFISDGHEVHVSSPNGERIRDLQQLGVIYHEIGFERRGMNPLQDYQIITAYRKLIKDIRPDICLGFTIKPNIYGAIAARKYHVPFVANITGLGTAVENAGRCQRFILLLYKYAFRKVQRVFFQNQENKEFFERHGLVSDNGTLIPGSGVNLMRFPYQEYPKGQTVKFAFVSRIMKEKGIDLFLDAAKKIKEKYDNIEFHVCGFCEAEYKGRLQIEAEKGTIAYHGMIRDVAAFMGQMHCIVHPTYYPEGISNVLLEACATGRPIITTDRSGCKEVVKDGVNGFMIPVKDSDALVTAIEKFMGLSWEERKRMGRNARKTTEENYDRQIIVEKYVEELHVNS